MSSLPDTMTLNVLLVDDQASTRLMVRAILDHAGHRVQECSTGADALAALTTSVFDCAVIDVHLPDMSGFELLRRCDVSSSRPSTVISMTSMPTTALVAEATAEGIDVVLKKPITGEQLATALASTTQNRLAPDSLVFVQDPIDPKVFSGIRALGDSDLIQRFIDQAIADATACVEAMDEISEEKAAGAWLAHAQALHGVALTLGARHLSAATSNALALSQTELFRDMSYLRREFARLITEARQWLDEHTTLLSSRERDCLRLAAAGHGTKRIASALEITEPTVKFHLMNAASKLQARGRVQSVARALELGAI